jgi:hypothetical protein
VGGGEEETDFVGSASRFPQAAQTSIASIASPATCILALLSMPGLLALPDRDQDACSGTKIPDFDMQIL